MPNFTRILAAANVATLSRLLARLDPKDRAWLARHVTANRDDRKTAALVEFGRLATLAHANAQYDIALNGERWLLEQLTPLGVRTLFDVGANRGDWCVAAFETNPMAAVHAFEIMDETADRLDQRVGTMRSRIKVNRCGLSDKSGMIAMYHTPRSDVHSSFLEGAHKMISNRDYVMLERPVAAGDDYMRDHGIDKIDFLKIDVEGAEALVLDGFRQALADQKIDLIQFEYGKHNLITRVFLQDFYTRLEEAGFVMGKLYPTGVAFKSYAIDDEDFIGPNYIACRYDRRDLLAAITYR